MKLNRFAWTVWGAALACAVVLMFLLPFCRNAAWWVAAGSTVLMFGHCAGTFVQSHRSDRIVVSRFFGCPIYKAGCVALIVQIIIGGVVMGLSGVIPFWAAFALESLVFSYTGISLAAKEVIPEDDTYGGERIQTGLTGWREIRQKAAGMPQNVRDAIRFADPTPTGLDGKIRAAVEAGDAGQVMKLLEQRKELAKLEKK